MSIAIPYNANSDAQAPGIFGRETNAIRMRLIESLSWIRAQYTRGIYKLGVASYRFGSAGFAELLFRHYLKLTEQADIIAARTTNGCPNVAAYSEFERAFTAFLERKWSAWSANEISPPIYGHNQSPPPRAALLRELSVLEVMPRYVQSNDRYLEYDLVDHLYRSLLNVGVDAQIFDADRICYPALFKLDPAKARTDLAALRLLVATTRPDVILFDGNYVGQSGSLDAAYLAELRTSFGPRLIAFIGDAWGKGGSHAVEYWAPVCDLIIHLVPDIQPDRQTRFSDKLMCIPYPVNERNFHPDKDRKFDVSFFGSRQTYLRVFWLACVRMGIAHLRLRSNIHASLRTNDCPSMPEYAAILRQSRIVLNFSTRDRVTKIITGRVWQALQSGVLLLEEDNEPTKYFFVPFIHYVPFENARQLTHMVEFFARNPFWANRIGEAAAQFCAEHYSAAEIWSRILAPFTAPVEA